MPGQSSGPDFASSANQLPNEFWLHLVTAQFTPDKLVSVKIKDETKDERRFLLA